MPAQQSFAFAATHQSINAILSFDFHHCALGQVVHRDAAFDLRLDDVAVDLITEPGTRRKHRRDGKAHIGHVKILSHLEPPDTLEFVRFAAHILWVAAALAAVDKSGAPEEVKTRLPALSSVYPQGWTPGAKVPVTVLGEYLDRAQAVVFLDTAPFHKCLHRLLRRAERDDSCLVRPWIGFVATELDRDGLGTGQLVIAIDPSRSPPKAG